MDLDIYLDTSEELTIILKLPLDYVLIIKQDIMQKYLFGVFVIAIVHTFNTH